MAEAARPIDSLDLGFAASDVARLNQSYAGKSAQEIVAGVLQDGLLGSVSLVSSFGTESAVLLHMVARVAPATPVVFIDTLKMFPETLAYRDALVAHLGLTNMQIITPDAARLAARDENGLRWSFDPDGCCELRKVEPLRRALNGVRAWISGRKGFQSESRAHIPLFELDEGRLKINPLAGWAKADLDSYFAAHDMPRHPLEAQGYPSIGCAPCTSKVLPGEDPRAGRWRGWDKTECGIHLPATSEDDSNLPVF